MSYDGEKGEVAVLNKALFSQGLRVRAVNGNT